MGDRKDKSPRRTKKIELVVSGCVTNTQFRCCTIESKHFQRISNFASLNTDFSFRLSDMHELIHLVHNSFTPVSLAS